MINIELQRFCIKVLVFLEINFKLLRDWNYISFKFFSYSQVSDRRTCSLLRYNRYNQNQFDSFFRFQKQKSYQDYIFTYFLAFLQKNISENFIPFLLLHFCSLIYLWKNITTWLLHSDCASNRDLRYSFLILLNYICRFTLSRNSRYTLFLLKVDLRENQ